MLKEKDICNIICYKHNKKVHRLFEKCFVVENNDSYLALSSEKGKVIESDGRNWQSQYQIIYFFFKNKWYNIIATIKEDGISYYVNIASPYVEIENNITYIDYDLDISLKTNNQLKILDENEYLLHYKQMKYDYRLDYYIKDALYEVMNLIREKKYPFDDKFVLSISEKYNKIKAEKEK